jgi:hypothetical protein
MTQGGRELLIKFDYVYPPIPIRTSDWMAYDDLSYDPDPDSRCQIGWGKTREEAAADLIMNFEMDEE